MPRILAEWNMQIQEMQIPTRPKRQKQPEEERQQRTLQRPVKLGARVPSMEKRYPFNQRSGSTRTQTHFNLPNGPSTD